MSTTSTATKAQELAAIAALAEQLGPASYLGPWLRDALPWLSDQITRDYLPLHARAMAEEAARVRAEAYSDVAAIRREASAYARQVIENAREKAREIREQAEAEADRIRGSAWQALRHAIQALEA